ncbi:hypothetical protein SDJN02_16864, partial [Cucurbita argyrosperma subsp. argyrosperma]
MDSVETTAVAAYKLPELQVQSPKFTIIKLHSITIHGIGELEKNRGRIFDCSGAVIGDVAYGGASVKKEEEEQVIDLEALFEAVNRNYQFRSFFLSVP